MKKSFERSERIILAGFKLLPPKTTLNGTRFYEFVRLYERLVLHPKECFSELLRGVTISENFLTEQERALLIIAQTAMKELEKSTRRRMCENDKRFWRVDGIIIPRTGNAHEDEII